MPHSAALRLRGFLVRLTRSSHMTVAVSPPMLAQKRWKSSRYNCQNRRQNKSAKRNNKMCASKPQRAFNPRSENCSGRDPTTLKEADAYARLGGRKHSIPNRNIVEGEIRRLHRSRRVRAIRPTTLPSTAALHRRVSLAAELSPACNFFSTVKMNSLLFYATCDAKGRVQS